MRPDELIERLLNLDVWKRRDERAPNKPLLILLYLGRLQQQRSRLARYEEISEKLRELLKDFGPPRKRPHPEFPFWYLKNEGIWEIPDDDLRAIEKVLKEKGQQEPTAATLRKLRARGGFAEPVRQLLEGNQELQERAARALLEANFPSTRHDEILQAVGISKANERQPGRPVRDPGFRDAVLTTYERRCAVCGYDMRSGDQLIGLDAAHIRWHACGGPDYVENGLALCALHHRTFDMGAIGLAETADDFRLVVSDTVNGQSEAVRLLIRHHGQPIRNP